MMRTYTIYDLMDACAKVDSWEETEESKNTLMKANTLLKAFKLRYAKTCWGHERSKDRFMEAMYRSYRIIKNSQNFTKNPFEGMLEAPEYIGNMCKVYSEYAEWPFKIIKDDQIKEKVATEMKLTVFRYFFGNVKKTVTLEDETLV